MGLDTVPSPLLQRVREAIRARHYSIRTEETYAFWVRRYILFHHKRHPEEMSEVEVGEFLTHLATQGEVAASTQNQALNAGLPRALEQVLDRSTRAFIWRGGNGRTPAQGGT